MILDIAREGDHLETLRAVRDKLAADMDAAPPAVVAQISGRLESVLDKIAELEKARPVEGSRFDELKDRRQRRDGGTSPKRRTSPGRNRDNRTG